MNFNVKNYLMLAISALMIAGIFSCKKSTEDYYPLTINDYFPLQTGKFITYKLDSLVYIRFGTKDTTRSYEVKFLVDSLVKDNLGRPAYRIFKFIRKTNTDSWTPQSTLMATNTGNTLELLDDNLRFIKLSFPIENDYYWKGNSYIETSSINSELTFMQNWQYHYSDVGESLSLGNYDLPNTLVVNQIDEVIGDVKKTNQYSEVTFSNEKYAYGLGMIYKKFLHRVYQPNNNGGGAVEDGSYGLTYTMIDHN